MYRLHRQDIIIFLAIFIVGIATLTSVSAGPSDYRMVYASVLDAEEGKDLTLLLVINNLAEEYARIQNVTIDIYSRDGTRLLQSSNIEKIPTVLDSAKETVELKIPHKLQEGSYTSEVKIWDDGVVIGRDGADFKIRKASWKNLYTPVCGSSDVPGPCILLLITAIAFIIFVIVFCLRHNRCKDKKVCLVELEDYKELKPKRKRRKKSIKKTSSQQGKK